MTIVEERVDEEGNPADPPSHEGIPASHLFAVCLWHIWKLRCTLLFDLFYRATVAWQAPPLGSYKMNVDAGFTMTGQASIAGVLRDSKVELLKSPVHPNHSSATLISACQRILRQRPSFTIQHVLREANRVAHHLAQYAKLRNHYLYDLAHIADLGFQSLDLNRSRSRSGGGVRSPGRWPVGILSPRR